MLLICYLRKNKKGSYQDAKKFIMNHINKCIYEKELEWNGIVNNKAWSIPIILTRTVIGAKLLYECFGKEDYECIVLTSEKNHKRVLRGRNSIRILYAWECDRDVNNGSKYNIQSRCAYYSNG